VVSRTCNKKYLIILFIGRTTSSDKISRNFAQILRQRSFYPIYPPPESVCIDYEAWQRYARIDQAPRVFIAASDMVNFNKEVNNCVCLNPGKLVKGSSNGTYAKIVVSNKPIVVEANKTIIASSNLALSKSILEEYQSLAVTQEANATKAEVPTTQLNQNEHPNFIGVSFHKI